MTLKIFSCVRFVDDFKRGGEKKTFCIKIKNNFKYFKK